MMWQQSRQYCKNIGSDLVVVESEEEQIFISNHIRLYDDENHIYWIGLNMLNEKNWLWVDGSNYNLR
ncbi:hypothetical protein LDENG_00278690 [Lucifuga dentata]|nr:hypothetical protein LDENG_00278690 [Lucifuga dentata]